MRIQALIVPLLLASACAFAGIRGIHGLRMGPSAIGANPCTLKLQDGETSNTTDEFISGNWLACRFTTVGAISTCTIELRLDTIGGANEPLDVAVYTDDTDHPGVIVGSFSAPILAATVTGDAFYTFTLTPSLSATTTYWLIIRAGDTDVACIVPVDNSGESPKDTMFSSDGLSWADQTASAVFNFRLNGQ